MTDEINRVRAYLTERERAEAETAFALAIHIVNLGNTRREVDRGLTDACVESVADGVNEKRVALRRALDNNPLEADRDDH